MIFSLNLNILNSIKMENNIRNHHLEVKVDRFQQSNGFILSGFVVED